MISHQHRCIFVHVPKTGGSTIEDIIWPGERTEEQLWMGFVSRFRNKHQTGGLQHLLARQIKAEVGAEIFESYFKFAFVRNPWDKAVSQYAFMANRPDLREMIGMKEDDSFAEYLKKTERHAHVQWEKQIEFLRDENGRILVDFVGRFETLDRDARIIFKRIGIKCGSIPVTNASRRGKYIDYYDDASREWIETHFAEDIQAFGYQFEAEPALLAGAR